MTEGGRRRRSNSSRKCYRKYVIGKGKFWDGVKKFFRNTKILSSVAGVVPGVGGVLSNVIKNQGYGRRHKGGMRKPKWLIRPQNKELLNLKQGGRRRRRRRRHRKYSNNNNFDNRYIDNKIRVL